MVISSAGHASQVEQMLEEHPDWENKVINYPKGVPGVPSMTDILVSGWLSNL